MLMRKFIVEELSKYNGKNGAPVYIAYEGKVYDVSSSFQWKRGKHQVVHIAGQDLTDALGDAPHGSDHLDKFPVVGILQED